MTSSHSEGTSRCLPRNPLGLVQRAHQTQQRKQQQQQQQQQQHHVVRWRLSSQSATTKYKLPLAPVASRAFRAQIWRSRSATMLLRCCWIMQTVALAPRAWRHGNTPPGRSFNLNALEGTEGLLRRLEDTCVRACVRACVCACDLKEEGERDSTQPVRLFYRHGVRPTLFLFC